MPKLRELGLAVLPMTLLHSDRESKKDLLRRLESIKKERVRQEVAYLLLNRPPPGRTVQSHSCSGKSGT
jgi:hypothetical protein